jgi:NSS family neurotransmitter:Na+ symporter
LIFRRVWRNRLAFYFLAVGSAFGLGNLWRFPYVVAENGGGAFVLIYLFLAFLMGLPLMVAELSLGKGMKQSVVPSFQDLGPKQEWVNFFGWAILSVNFLVLAFYAVISGWVLHYLVQFVRGFVTSDWQLARFSFEVLEESSFLQLGLSGLHLWLIGTLVAKGLDKGVERSIGLIMAVFALLLIYLIRFTLDLPSTSQALRFLFYPDFSKLNLGSLLAACGHVFFSLSIGFGLLVTFGSYLDEKEATPKAGFRICFIDSLVSLLAGLIVFPIAIAVSGTVLSNPTLLFDSLPTFFLTLTPHQSIGVWFFLCLYCASMGSSLGLLENSVSNLMDVFRVKRKIAVILSLGVVFILAALILLMQDWVAESWARGTALGIVDFVVINILLPVMVLVFSIFFLKYFPAKKMRDLFIEKESIESESLFLNWIFSLRYLVPFFIGLAFFLQGLAWIMAFVV